MVVVLDGGVVCGVGSAVVMVVLETGLVNF